MRFAKHLSRVARVRRRSVYLKWHSKSGFPEVDRPNPNCVEGAAAQIFEGSDPDHGQDRRTTCQHRRSNIVAALLGHTNDQHAEREFLVSVRRRA